MISELDKLDPDQILTLEGHEVTLKELRESLTDEEIIRAVNAGLVFIRYKPKSTAFSAYSAIPLTPIDYTQIYNDFFRPPTKTEKIANAIWSSLEFLTNLVIISLPATLVFLGTFLLTQMTGSPDFLSAGKIVSSVTEGVSIAILALMYVSRRYDA